MKKLIQNETEQDSGEIERDPYTDLVRLLVGGIFEGGSVFLNWLDLDRGHRRTGSTSDQGDEELSSSRRAEHAAVGFIFRSVETARDNLRIAMRVSETMGGIILCANPEDIEKYTFSPTAQSIRNAGSQR